MTMNLKELEAKRLEFMKLMKQLDEDDILAACSWAHQQNVESSEKLLHQLEFYHGRDKC